MQSENFDNKLKQAAEQHHPNYDEGAWAKMEKLLDRELPQKKDRRRRFIFLIFFFLLLGGGGAWLFTEKPWHRDELTGSRESESSPEDKAGRNNNSGDKTGVGSDTSITPGGTDETGKSRTEKNATSAPGDLKKGSNKTETDHQTILPVRAANNTAIVTVTSGRKGVSKQSGARSTEKPTRRDNVFEAEVLQGGIAGNRRPEKTESDKNDKDKGESRIAADNSDVSGKKSKPVTDTDVIPPRYSNKADSTADHVVDGREMSDMVRQRDSQKDSGGKFSEPRKEAKAGKQGKKRNTFSFSVSAGPDVSAVGVDNPGKVRMVSGAGIGYTIRRRWTIRTGFYSARKLYEAKPGDYKPTAPVLFPDYLKNISADCRVYEIPLTVAYNFGRSAKGGPFASAGLSSFIMKKEKYDYMYLYPGNPQPYYYTHEENNKYKHYFSVLSLSGGYQRRISRTFSLAVEPYLKVPLSGVGYGKVKLNSAGILFSLNVTPFGQGNGK